MDKKRNPRRTSKAFPPDGKGIPKVAGETLFNDWLEDKLRGAYSSVLDEPIPDDLIKLINEKLKD